MLRPRLVFVVLAAALAMAVGISAAVVASHRSGAPTGTTLAASASPTTTSPAAATTTIATASSGGAARTPPTAAAPLRITDPAVAARHLFDAWQAGDRRRALQAATPPAVHDLFAIRPSSPPRFAGCRSQLPRFRCHYWIPSADGVFYVDMLVEGGASAGYRVVAVEAPLRLTSPADAARHLMKAWVADDKAEARKAASKAAVDALWGGLHDRAHPPSFAGCSGRDGGFDCAWTAGGGGLTMRTVGGASAGWSVEAVRFGAS
jgi:hypothetical protein